MANYWDSCQFNKNYLQMLCFIKMWRIYEPIKVFSIHGRKIYVASNMIING